MRLIGEFGEGEQVAEAEALRGFPLVTVAVDPRKGNVAAGDAAAIVFSNSRLDGSDPEFCDRFVVGSH